MADRLWAYCMPGLTGDAFEAVAREIGLIKEVDLGGGRRVDVSPKVNEMTQEQWDGLKEACRLRLGLPLDWRRQLEEDPVYRAWRRQRAAEGFFWSPGDPNTPPSIRQTATREERR